MLAASPVVIYLLHGSAFAVDFAILRSHFWNRQTVPKWNRESAFLLFFNRSHFWNRVPVHFLFFCIKVAEAQRFGSVKLCGLWRPEGQLGRPF